MPRRRSERLPAEAAVTMKTASHARASAQRRLQPERFHDQTRRLLKAGDAKGAFELIRAWRALLVATRETQSFRSYLRDQRRYADSRREQDREHRRR